MFAKVKSSVFIDSVKLEVTESPVNLLQGVLHDDHGCICGTFETPTPVRDNQLIWKGLNNLPYGVYTLTLKQGEDEIKMRLVKRV